MTKIKICGLTRDEDIIAVNKYKPEYIGVVFWRKSRRYVTPEMVRRWRQMLDENIKVVGVFVDEELSTVATLLNEGIIDIAQLHGHEDEVYVHVLREQTSKSIIKAFVIKEGSDINKVNKSMADHVLLDAGMGEGRSFDWKLLRNVERPFFLAGGLNPENVENAVKQIKPFAVDVSSGVETDGFKDEVKIEEFMKKARKHGDR